MPNDATRANMKALPETSRRRFLLNAALTGAAVAVVAPVEAAEPEMPPREKAIWHMRELEKLLWADGVKMMHVAIVGEYRPGDCRSLAIQHSGKLVDLGGLFAAKGGAA